MEWKKNMKKIEKLAIQNGYTLKQVIDPIIAENIRLKAIKWNGNLYGWKAFKDGRFLGYYWLPKN